ncbi:MAG: hypothetical protein CMO55_14605 [Verrucomicrobiales bacterium]|nr:hypothetical protein [Verrucomicrobiales bacterium]
MLYTRNYYNSETNHVELNAFRPEKHDTDGVSVSFKPPRTDEQEGLSGRNPGGYEVATIPEKALESHQISVREDPTPENPAHAIIPELRYENRRSDRAYELMKALSDAVTEVTGPYFPEKESSRG